MPPEPQRLAETDETDSQKTWLATYHKLIKQAAEAEETDGPEPTKRVTRRIE